MMIVGMGSFVWFLFLVVMVLKVLNLEVSVVIMVFSVVFKLSVLGIFFYF